MFVWLIYLQYLRVYLATQCVNYDPEYVCSEQCALYIIHYNPSYPNRNQVIIKRALESRMNDQAHPSCTVSQGSSYIPPFIYSDFIILYTSLLYRHILPFLITRSSIVQYPKMISPSIFPCTDYILMIYHYYIPIIPHYIPLYHTYYPNSSCPYMGLVDNIQYIVFPTKWRLSSFGLLKLHFLNDIPHFYP